MVRLIAGLLLFELVILSPAHRLGDEEDDSAAIRILADGGDFVNSDEDNGRPDDAPPRLQHLIKGKDGRDLMKEFWAKSTKSPKIIFADSGVGGLSIMSKFINLFKKDPLFRNAQIIFFDTAGLNKDAHSKVVKDLLNEIEQLSPDMLFIACNGMSKVYLESDKAQDPKYPVIQMLPFAVDYWGHKLEHDKSSSLVQFVSDFTGGTYITLMTMKSSLIKAGIDRDRLVVQTCQPAITAIQDEGPNSKAAKKEIQSCAKDALEKLEKNDLHNKKLFLGMGCTHFGWAEEHWKEAMEKGNEAKHVEVLDPNIKMAEWLFDQRPDDLDPGGEQDEVGIEVAVILRRAYKMDKIKELVAEPIRDAIEKARVMDDN